MVKKVSLNIPDDIFCFLPCGSGLILEKKDSVRGIEEEL